jgi:NAD(P)-dependent dehydrogenase (short-subunit alcohol dehydrogenase family)
LVNNAGIIHPTRLEEIGETQWQETLAVHLTGTFHGIQSVVPVMRAQGGGKIINVAAPSALRGSFGVADYAAAKGGIIALTRNAASELKPYNIQVNCISPVAETRMTDVLLLSVVNIWVNPWRHLAMPNWLPRKLLPPPLSFLPVPMLTTFRVRSSPLMVD